MSTLRARISGQHKVGPGLRRILENMGWLTGDRVIRTGVGLVVGAWLARYLGPDRFGLLNYAVAIAALFGPLATFGLDSIVVRELVKTPEKRDVIIGSAFTVKLIGALVAFAGVVGAISIMRPDETLTLWIVSLSAAGFVFQSLNVVDLFFQAKVQARYSVYAGNSAFLLMALVKAILILAGAQLIAFAWAGLGEIAFTGIFLLAAYRARHMIVWNWRPRLNVMLELLSAGWPLMLTGISVMISMRVDQVLIGQMLSDKQVGLYSAAARISEMWYFVPIALSGSAFPMLIENKKHSEAIYYQKLQKLYTSMVMLAIGFALVMTFLSGPVVKLMYGPKYAVSASVLSVLIWSGVPVSFGCVWSKWMVLENKTKTMFLFQVTSAVINVILNLLLIPRFGIMGSAYATLMSYWFGHTILAAVLKPQHKALAMLGRAVFPFPDFYLWFIRRAPSA
jgi:PST family polysaccharide transporter